MNSRCAQMGPDLTFWISKSFDKTIARSVWLAENLNFQSAIRLGATFKR